MRIENFKSWAQAELAFGDITGLFGTNSSGKSSLLQFLLLLKQTREASDRAVALDLNGPFVQFGTMQDILHGHDQRRAISFSLGFKQPTELKLVDLALTGKNELVTSSDLMVKAEVEAHRQAPRSRALTYAVGNATFALDLEPEREGSSIFSLTARVPDSEFKFTRTRGRPLRLSRPLKTYRFPDEVRTGFQNTGFLADLETAFEAALDRLFYLGPLRDVPKRDYLWSRSRPRDVGVKGEKTIDAIIAAQAADERQNLKPGGWRRPFAYVVAHWLRELGLIHQFEISEIAPGSNRWQARMRTRPGGPLVMLTDVGFGVSQVLPVITLLHYVPRGSTVILEQPEIHLHPLAQAELAELIIHAARHRKVQVILESHSEHLLLRLQRRIAQQSIEAAAVSLYFCQMPTGASRIEALQLDQFGNIGNWPPKFMGDAFSETAQAELARRAAARPQDSPARTAAGAPLVGLLQGSRSPERARAPDRTAPVWSPGAPDREDGVSAVRVLRVRRGAGYRRGRVCAFWPPAAPGARTPCSSPATSVKGSSRRRSPGEPWGSTSAGARQTTLRVNYRTSHQIRRQAHRLLPPGGPAAG